MLRLVSLAIVNLCGLTQEVKQRKEKKKFTNFQIKGEFHEETNK